MGYLWPGRQGPSVDYISPPPSLDWQKQSKRNLVIMGATGSIGTSALSIVERYPDRFQILGLAAGHNVELLAKQALKFHPAHLAVFDDIHAQKLKDILPKDYLPQIHFGVEGYAYMAALAKADLVVSAQVGAAGLPATLAAALAGKVIALANKEALVLAGDLIRKVCQWTGASILPLDSEHFAIFQCLLGREQNADKLIITASGGPFRTLSVHELREVRVEDALKHPNWKMGRKISVDSATMMNKSLEVIEAAHLFGVPEEKIEVLVHPQSIIHSLVVLRDNSLLAQMAAPDMRGPIAACLFWPECPQPILASPDLAALGTLTFEAPDRVRFPALELARRALRNENYAEVNPHCVVLNAANEMAVEFFLRGLCRFNEISELVDAAMNVLAYVPTETLPDLPTDANNIPALASAIWEILSKLDLRSRAFVSSCVLGRSLK